VCPGECRASHRGCRGTKVQGQPELHSESLSQKIGGKKERKGGKERGRKEERMKGRKEVGRERGKCCYV
jgi:hypothetical protein